MIRSDGMAYWDCPKCAAENSLEANCCWRCGFQNYAGFVGAAATHDQPGKSGESIEEQSRDLLQKMRMDLSQALDDGKASIKRLARKHPGGTGTDDAG